MRRPPRLRFLRVRIVKSGGLKRVGTGYRNQTFRPDCSSPRISRPGVRGSLILDRTVALRVALSIVGASAYISPDTAPARAGHWSAFNSALANSHACKFLRR